MDIFMRQWWHDPRFKNNYSKPFNMAADPTKLFWTPDTYFWNVKDAKYHHVTRENMRVKISPNGEIYYSTRYNDNTKLDASICLKKLCFCNCACICLSLSCNYWFILQLFCFVMPEMQVSIICIQKGENSMCYLVQTPFSGEEGGGDTFIFQYITVDKISIFFPYEY